MHILDNFMIHYLRRFDTLRNVNVHIVYGLAQSMWVILEHDVLDVDALVLVLNGS